MKVLIEQIQTGKRLLEYESEIIVPLVGDIYAGCKFKDGYQRTIKERQLYPGAPNVILVLVDYSYPSLVKTEMKLTTSTEMDMATVVS